MDKYIGKRLDGRYEIHEMIGVGGMAYVYRSYDRVENRWVAIKILKDELSHDSDFLRRFRNESKAIAVLSHANIVDIYDVSFGDQIQYIAMEYVDGITLKQYINQQGVIRWQEALHFTIQILDALECAHKKGIIHRDIKPQNILLLTDGKIKVMDFGIARFLKNETQTMTDKAIGSVHYISPEQAKGEYITDKADIYSLGAVLYELLTGKMPFQAENAVSVALMQIQTKPRPLREVNPSLPIGLEQIALKAMQKNPADRFQSAAEMWDDIETFIEDPNTVFDYTVGNQELKATNVIESYDAAHVAPSYSDNYEYEEELVKSKRRKKGSMAITGIVIAIFVVLITVGVIYAMDVFKGLDNDKDDQVIVPDFMGMNYETQIKDNDEFKDFRFKINEANDPEKEAGTVINQTPNNGIAVKKGKEVTLVVIKGEEENVIVPELKNYEQSAAVNTLNNMGFGYKIESVNDETTDIGHVISTDPVSGSAVKPKTVVTVYVSKGTSKEQVTVPKDMVGSSLEKAKTKITDAGLAVGNISYNEDSSESKDVVLSTSPESGTKLSEGSTVDIVVSSGKSSTKSVSYSVSLPKNVYQDIYLKVYRNGSLLQEEYVNPSYASTYSLTLSGTGGVDSVVIQLDGQEYMYINYDFDNQSATMTKQLEYTPPSSSGGGNTPSSSESNGDDNA